MLPACLLAGEHELPARPRYLTDEEACVLTLHVHIEPLGSSRNRAECNDRALGLICSEEGADVRLFVVH
jgi:hypothetical protein